MTRRSAWTIAAVILLAVLAALWPGTGILERVVSPFSPDQALQERTLYLIWIFGAADLACAFLLALRGRARLDRRMLFAAIIILAAQAIFLFDRRVCQGEQYALKYPTTLSFLVGAGFALHHWIKCQRNPGVKPIIKSFLLLAAAGFLLAGADEMFLIHENIGYRLIKPHLGPAQDGGSAFLGHPDDYVTLAYALAALIVLAVFFRPLAAAPKTALLPLFLLGIAAQLGAILSEMVRHPCAEEYFELSAGLLFALALWSFPRLKTP